MSLDQSFIVFEIDGSAYGLRCSEVQHIEMLDQITPVPNTAPAVEGVVFSRGRVFPALNLRVRFGGVRVPHTLQTRLLFVNILDRAVALIVDSAREFHQVAEDCIRPVDATLVGVAGNYVEGVATLRERPVLILNMAKVISLEEITLPQDGKAPAGVAH